MSKPKLHGLKRFANIYSHDLKINISKYININMLMKIHLNRIKSICVNKPRYVEQQTEVPPINLSWGKQQPGGWKHLFNLVDADLVKNS